MKSLFFRYFAEAFGDTAFADGTEEHMSIADQGTTDKREFLLGNEAIARGALEAGVQFAAGYPGTPSSEILQTLLNAAKQLNIHAEWSINEKVAAEKAAAAAVAGLRSMATMKNAGLSVALDFITHLSLSGLGTGPGAMVVAVCDDPSAHSSGDETDSRWLAKFGCLPMLEPSSVQEAKEMVKYLFDLSEEFKQVTMLRSYTRLSHATSSVEVGALPEFNRKSYSDPSDFINPYLGLAKHMATLARLREIAPRFETSSFNTYEGPESPELLIVCSGAGHLCSKDAIELLGLQEKVAILTIGTIWPFPKRTVQDHLRKSKQILSVEEVDPFVEIHVKEAIVDGKLEQKTVYGKASGHIPVFGEMTPDTVVAALNSLFNLDYQPRNTLFPRESRAQSDELLITRGLAWCPGCPHRASFWALEKAVKADGRGAYVTGDIGCYCLDIQPNSKHQENLMHAMGSGAGQADGLGMLGQFGHEQPVISVCGDSTFFHASIPALVDAVYHKSEMIQIVFDNDVTAMTGLQPHPGVPYDGLGEPKRRIDIETLCQSLGCEVEVCDPFDIRATTKKMRELMKREGGVRVLILRRACELKRMKQEKTTPYRMRIDQETCKGSECEICSSQFQCPAFDRDAVTGKAMVREDICSGCGVCVDVCPFKAIFKEAKAA